MGISLNSGTWLTIAAVVIFTIGSWITAFITAHHQRRVLGEVEVVRGQVQNNHPSNLRDDLDEVRKAVFNIRDDVRGVRQDVADMRGEIRDERSARVELEHRVEHLARRRNQGH